ncbi:MAG: alpha/beta fold hydrolase [Spirochaetales bacterium]|nr:alpha/beta fold hydrolase [Spirochaetales bacterium]
MTITDDGIRLDAVLDMPGHFSGRCPVVVIIHGFSGYKEEPHIVAVSNALNDIGFATLRADMYGHGQSDGRFCDHNLYKWLGNALTLIDYARSLDFASGIYLCGHSQGGLTVILAAALKHDVIDAVIPLSPAICIPEDARRGDILGIGFDPENIPDMVRFPDGKDLGGNYLRIAQTIDVNAAIDRYSGSVLIVHGSEDECIPVRCSVEASRRYRKADLVLVEGEDHCYNFHLDEVVRAVTSWMSKFSIKGEING